VDGDDGEAAFGAAHHVVAALDAGY
jgi:hypothetical protein